MSKNMLINNFHDHALPITVEEARNTIEKLKTNLKSLNYEIESIKINDQLCLNGLVKDNLYELDDIPHLQMTMEYMIDEIIYYENEILKIKMKL